MRREMGSQGDVLRGHPERDAWSSGKVTEALGEGASLRDTTETVALVEALYPQAQHGHPWTSK